MYTTPLTQNQWLNKRHTDLGRSILCSLDNLPKWPLSRVATFVPFWNIVFKIRCIGKIQNGCNSEWGINYTVPSAGAWYAGGFSLLAVVERPADCPTTQRRENGGAGRGRRTDVNALILIQLNLQKENSINPQSWTPIWNGCWSSQWDVHCVVTSV